MLIIGDNCDIPIISFSLYQNHEYDIILHHTFVHLVVLWEDKHSMSAIIISVVW